jgi:hypothetical protein
MHPWTLYALEVSRDREREIRNRLILAQAPDDLTSHPSPLRRPVARALAALSRGSAAAVRRLDDCIADDLGRSLAPSEQ